MEVVIQSRVKTTLSAFTIEKVCDNFVQLQALTPFINCTARGVLTCAENLQILEYGCKQS